STWAGSVSTTDTDGRFSLAASSGTHRLDFVGPNFKGQAYESTGAIHVQTAPFSVTEDIDLGNVHFPALRTINVTVLDSEGSPVQGAEINGEGGALDLGANWSLTDHPLSPDLEASTAAYYLRTTADDHGQAIIDVPVQPGDT